MNGSLVNVRLHKRLNEDYDAEITTEDYVSLEEMLRDGD